VSSQVVTYQVDESTQVSFEIEPTEGFRPASPSHAIGKISEAVTPAIEAAKTVLNKVREISPDEVELTFGIKVSGGANWLIAKSAGEANFEVRLTWSPRDRPDDDQPEDPAAAEPTEAASEPNPDGTTEE
jgi:hypothetical protein